MKTPLDNLQASELPIEKGVAMLHTTSSSDGKFTPRGGGEMMSNPKKLRVGLVRVQIEGSRYRLRWSDPASGRECKRTIQGIPFKQVESICLQISANVLSGKGLLPGVPDLPSIEEGIAKAIRLSSASAKTKAEWVRVSSRFIAWLAGSHPRCRTFADLKPSILQEYVSTLERVGRAYDSIRLYLQPVRMGWRQEHQDNPQTVSPVPRLKLSVQPPLQAPILDPEMIPSLFRFMEDSSDPLLPVVALMVGCGLRTLEAVNVTAADFSDAGWVTVRDSELHQLKTRYSERRVPVPRAILDLLQRWIDRQHVSFISGPLFRGPRGNAWSKDSVCQAARRLMQKAASMLKDERYGCVPFHRLRATYATLLTREGVPDRVIQRCMGHAATTVLGQHYQVTHTEELRVASEAWDRWYQAYLESETGMISAKACDDMR